MKHHYRLRRLVVSACRACFLLSLMYACPASAYDNDTHYLLTYYLARQVGYTPEQSYKIANADVSVDLDANTQPMIYLPPKGPEVRSRFHAFYDEALPAGQREGAKVARQTELYQIALKTANPGMYLHFLQDTYAHRHPNGTPYGNIFGHWSPSLSHLTGGHSPDYLSNNLERAQGMAQATYNELARYRTDLLHQASLPMDRAKIDAVLRILEDANPTDDAKSPDEAKAKAALEQFWGETIKPKVEYHLNSDGTPVEGQNVIASLLSKSPLSVAPILVIDRSGSLKQQPGAIEQIQNKATDVVQAILDSVGEAAVINFSGMGDAKADADFTSDPDKLLKAIKNPSTASTGTAIYDAVEAAVALATAHHQISILILFTDGMNNQGNGMAAAERYCKENRIAIIVVGFIGTEGRNEITLKQLAEDTDGFYIPNETASILTILQRFKAYSDAKQSTRINGTSE